MDPRELVFMSYTSQSTGNANDWRGARCGTSWRPLEIVAMILGFVLFWPIGLAILGGREMAVDRIARRIPFLAELVGDAVAEQATPDGGADDWGDDEGPVAPFVVDL